MVVVVCLALVAVPNVPIDGEIPVLHFSHNVEYMIWKRLWETETRPLRRAALALEWRKVRRYERQACRTAALTVAVSEEDRNQLGEEAPEARIEAVPTGVDLDFYRPAPAAAERPRELVFTGSMDWHPNEDAMLHFMDAILPSCSISSWVPHGSMSTCTQPSTR